MPAPSRSTRFGELTANTVDLLLQSAFGNRMTTARFEGHCAGDRLATVSSAVVCYAPTVDLLRRAAAEGRTLVIAREHPFYLHGGVIPSYSTEGLLREDPVAVPQGTETDRDLMQFSGLHGDDVVEEKRRLIDAEGLVVYRFGAAWDDFRPAAQSAALARALGLPVPPSADDERARSRAVVSDLGGPRTMPEIAATIRAAVDGAMVRIVGDPAHVARRAIFLSGETDPKQAFADVLADDPSVDLIITGGGGILDEVDGGIAYFRDVAASGRRIAMLTIGFGPSQEPGVRSMAEAIGAAVPDLDVAYWPSDHAAWIPANGVVR